MHVQKFKSDLSDDFLSQAVAAGSIACDIETTGLDWSSDAIGLIQVFVHPENVALIHPTVDHRPERLISLLSTSAVRKLFHHAMFDLRFLVHNWSFVPNKVCCTKIASKLLNSASEGHSLKDLIWGNLGISISKAQQQSLWTTDDLNEDQIEYAINDVQHLPNLFAVLYRKLQERNLTPLAESCFQHISTKVLLDVAGYEKIYDY